jgi:SAM-dependent methyltransferase
MEPPAQTRRSRLSHSWLIGLVLYGCAVAYIGWAPLRDSLAAVRLPWLLSMGALMLVSLWLRAMKWRWALGPNQSAAGLFFLSKAAGGYSPARIGELAPLLIPRHRTPRLAAWIVLDRLLETGATVGLGIAGCIALGLPQRAMGAVFAAALILLVVLPFYLLTRRALFERAAGWFPNESTPRRLCMTVASVSDEIRSFRAMLPIAGAWSAACTMLDLAVGMLLYYSFGYAVPFSLLAVVQCAHGIASAVPFLPNATGGPYLVAAGLLYKFAAIPEGVLATAVGINVALSNVLFWASFTLGAASLRASRKDFSDQGQLFDYLSTEEGLYEYEPESLARLDALVVNKGRTLDLGCGDGAIGGALRADAVFAADISPKCAALAARKGLFAVVADARSLPFREGAFDTVYCVDMLHHLPGEWGTVMAEVDRVVQPGGRMAVIEPDARYAFVRWTQAPNSPIRVAPHHNEPAIDPARLLPFIDSGKFQIEMNPIRIDGRQITRSVFPMWQRLLNAPFVIALALWHGSRPNKFAIVARKAARHDNGERLVNE